MLNERLTLADGDTLEPTIACACGRKHGFVIEIAEILRGTGYYCATGLPHADSVVLVVREKEAAR